MTDDRGGYRGEAPIDGAPTWLRALQAALIGVVAGLALHALLSFVVLHGEVPNPKNPGPSQCKKSTPARSAEQPSAVPRVSGLVLTDGRATRG
jgi:hypothetical protein